MNSKIASLGITFVVCFAALTAFASPRRPNRPDAGIQPPYELAVRMCAGSQEQSDAVTITRWDEWLASSRLPLLRTYTHLQNAADIRTRLVHGTCGETTYQLTAIESEVWYPQADGRLGRTPRPTPGRDGVGDAFGFGGLGSSGTGWGGGRTGESMLGMGDIGNLGNEFTPRPTPPACNTAIIIIEARFRASDWCGVRAEDELPRTYIPNTARVVSTRPAYRPPTTRRP